MSDQSIERLKTRLAELIEVMAVNGEEREAPILYQIALSDPVIIHDSDIVQSCFKRGLYEICRLVSQEDTKVAKKEQTLAERLAYFNVPHEQRKIILQLGISNVRCPLRNNIYIDLYGPKQASAEEIRSAAQAYDPQIKALQRNRRLLFALATLLEKRGRLNRPEVIQ
jgi:hypothetical protein